MGQLDGKSAIVTGAGRGFGRAIACAIAREGADVTLVARSKQELDDVAQEIGDAGGRALAAIADAADVQTLWGAHAAHEAMFGPASILVNCAGVAQPVGPIGHTDPQEWWRTMAINVRAPLELMNRVLPGMKQAGNGTVVNVTSIAAFAILPHNSAYCVSKAAQHRLSEHVAREVADTQIGIFSVHPGAVFTKLMADEAQSPDMQRWMPEIADMFETLKGSPTNALFLARCADHCVALATGQYHHLSGCFLDLSIEDLEASAIQMGHPSG